MFTNYGKKLDMIKMYVRRVFITDNFEEMMPKYLSFVKGVVDSDDLPLNVSRETLQQHKLLKVIKKKLVRKTLDMIKKMTSEQFDQFWKEFSTNIKLGVIEDHANRTRLSRLLKFSSSHSLDELSSLGDYVERMKEGQDSIYYVAGTSREEGEKSPFVEKLLKKGFEVLYLTEAVDEYCIQALPEFEGKKFQNVAKEGVRLDASEKAKQRKEALEREYEPLMEYMMNHALPGKIEKAVISDRLTTSPCALVATTSGWSGNMERIMKSQAYQKSKDTGNEYYSGQKKILEMNPRHPLVKKLKQRAGEDRENPTTKDLALVLYESAVLRSGYSLTDTLGFSQRIESMLRLSMEIPLDEPIEEEPDENDEIQDEASIDSDTPDSTESGQAEEPKESKEEFIEDESEEKVSKNKTFALFF